MELEVLGYISAILVGVALGLIGSGGSILTVPILVYMMSVDPVLATAYSLFVVGATSLVGGVKNILNKMVDLKTAVVFGVPSIIAVYLTRAYLVPFIPEVIFSVGDFQLTKSIALMLLFAVVMILASMSMIKPRKKTNDYDLSSIKYNYPLVLLEGSLVGVLTGLVGAGGGFLIIPALVILARMPMKLAVGTSLLIIAAKSLLGFLGDIQSDRNIDWILLSIFTGLSVAGIFIGIYLSKKIDGDKLKTGFGWFVLLMGVYIIIKELFLS